MKTTKNQNFESPLARLGRLCRSNPTLVGLIFFSRVLAGSNVYAYTDEQIVSAIYKTEGGAKAQYAYGIRSVHYETIEEAKRICLRTVRNNRKRWEKAGRPNDFLSFLANRYAPKKAENDKRGLNKNWLKNVKYFLEKETTMDNGFNAACPSGNTMVDCGKTRNPREYSVFDTCPVCDGTGYIQNVEKVRIKETVHIEILEYRIKYREEPAFRWIMDRYRHYWKFGIECPDCNR